MEDTRNTLPVADGETSALLSSAPQISAVRRFFTETMRHRPVPEHEVDTLSPYQKLIKYRVIPCKLLLNAIILTMLLANVFVYQIARSAYEQETRTAFEAAFLPNQDNLGVETTAIIDWTTSYQVFFTNTSDVVRFMQKSTKRYLSLVRNNPGHLNFFLDEVNKSSIRYPTMRVSRRDSSLRTDMLDRFKNNPWSKNINTINVTTYKLGMDSLAGPFGECAYPWQRVRNDDPSPPLHHHHVGAGQCDATHFDGSWYFPCRSGSQEESCNDIFDSVDKVDVEMSYLSVREASNTPRPPQH